MKIVHVEDYFDPTAGYQINELIKGHNKSKDEVIVITSNDMSPFHKKVDVNEDREYEEKMGIKIIRLKPIFKISSRLLYKNLFNVIDEISPDVLFMHGIGDFKDLVLFKKNKNYIIVRDCHMSWVASKNKFRKLFFYFYKLIFSKLINQSEKYKKIFALGNEEYEYLINLGINNDKIEYLKHGYDAETMFYSEPERKRIREQYGIPNENIVISYIGKFDNYKKPDYVFDIIKELPQQVLDDNSISLLFIGKKESEYMKSFNSKMKTVDKSINIIIDDSKKFNELYKYYSASDICIFPEQTTLSSIHAQVCGCPVMMVNYESNIERVIDNNNLYSGNDFGEAASILARIINNREFNKKEVLEKNINLENREYSNQIKQLNTLLED